MAGRFFDEWQVGDVVAHTVTRTVTETDNVLVSALTHNPQPMHLDHEVAAVSEFGIDLTQQHLEAVAQLAVPGEEGGTAMNMRRLVNLVLFEPEADAARDEIVPTARMVALVQFDDRVTQPAPLGDTDRRNISANAISDSHDLFLSSL